MSSPATWGAHPWTTPRSRPCGRWSPRGRAPGWSARPPDGAANRTTTTCTRTSPWTGRPSRWSSPRAAAGHPGHASGVRPPGCAPPIAAGGPRCSPRWTTGTTWTSRPPPACSTRAPGWIRASSQRSAVLAAGRSGPGHRGPTASGICTAARPTASTEPATCHLGVDVIVARGTRAVAPWSGVIAAGEPWETRLVGPDGWDVLLHGARPLRAVGPGCGPAPRSPR